MFLSFQSFNRAPWDWFADQVERHKSANAIVLDLRENAGGALEVQRNVFDLFFRTKTLVGKFRDRNGKEHTYNIEGRKSAYQGRLFVLIGPNTQSASETFAAAIQESGRGVVIGQRSKGEVMLGTHYKLPNGYDLHLAMMNYHTAKGIRLEGRGVIPDLEVGVTIKDFQENRDAALEKVNALLQQQ